MANEHAQRNECEQQVVIQRDRRQFDETQIELARQGVAHDGDRINRANAFGPVGEVDGLVQVVQKHANDFAKTQGDDGQVIAAQFERGRTQQHTEQTGQACRQRQHQPQADVQAIGEGQRQTGKRLQQLRRRQQAKQVRPHRKKGDIA